MWPGSSSWAGLQAIHLASESVTSRRVTTLVWEMRRAWAGAIQTGWRVEMKMMRRWWCQPWAVDHMGENLRRRHGLDLGLVFLQKRKFGPMKADKGCSPLHRMPVSNLRTHQQGFLATFRAAVCMEETLVTLLGWIENTRGRLLEWRQSLSHQKLWSQLKSYLPQTLEVGQLLRRLWALSIKWLRQFVISCVSCWVKAVLSPFMAGSESMLWSFQSHLQALVLHPLTCQTQGFIGYNVAFPLVTKKTPLHSSYEVLEPSLSKLTGNFGP